MSQTFAMIEMIASFGVIFGFLIWQWLSVNRDIAKRKERERAEAGSASPEAPGHAEGQHQLDER